MVSEKKFYARETPHWTRKSIYKEVLWTIQDINFYDEDEGIDRPGLTIFPETKLSAKDCQWFADRAYDIQWPQTDVALASLSRALYKRVCRRLKIKISKLYDINFSE